MRRASRSVPSSAQPRRSTPAPACRLSEDGLAAQREDRVHRLALGAQVERRACLRLDHRSRGTIGRGRARGDPLQPTRPERERQRRGPAVGADGAGAAGAGARAARRGARHRPLGRRQLRLLPARHRWRGSVRGRAAHPPVGDDVRPVGAAAPRRRAAGRWRALDLGRLPRRDRGHPRPDPAHLPRRRTDASACPPARSPPSSTGGRSPNAWPGSSARRWSRASSAPRRAKDRWSSACAAG